MFSDEELNDILRLLSAVLHLGNLKFEGRKVLLDCERGFSGIFLSATTTQNMDTCEVVNTNDLRTIAKLLKVPIERVLFGNTNFSL